MDLGSVVVLLEKEVMDSVVHFEMETEEHVDENPVNVTEFHVVWYQNSDSDHETETVHVVHVHPVMETDYDSVISAIVIVQSVDCDLSETRTTIVRSLWDVAEASDGSSFPREPRRRRPAISCHPTIHCAYGSWPSLHRVAWRRPPQH
ncbi:unnamed protein product [Peronospora destructor]|uniref:Uncharacterized protein n=1 Tax=Peronospora destructor TaxID=86335 RepID=A0AAV0TC45_9STRA|nr:unnamed protein product [Peronospora destructor]